MLSYELAKKLKDAGFPQRFRNEGLSYTEHDSTLTVAECNAAVRKFGIGGVDFAISVPTLSELIEECGKGVFFDLVKFRDGWVATDHYYRGVAKTPEEAVAQLYLVMNSNVR